MGKIALKIVFKLKLFPYKILDPAAAEPTWHTWNIQAQILVWTLR